MDFTYSKLFIAFGLDNDDNNKIHIDVEPFTKDSATLAEVFTAITDTVISQLPEKDQIKYEQKFLREFKKAMKERHETLDITRTEL